MKEFIQSLGNKQPIGDAISFQPYLNSPKLYYKYAKDLNVIFQLKEDILKKSRLIIDKSIQQSTNPPSVIIGIHVRSNQDYIKHLKTFQMKPIGTTYYTNAIAYFNQLYDNPLYLIVSDSKEAAMKLILKPNEKKSECCLDNYFKSRLGPKAQGGMMKKNQEKY